MTNIQFNNALTNLEKPLYFYAVRLTTDKENAKDLLQETLLKALAYKNKFRENTNFKAWVYTIMKNTFINNYRRNIRASEVFDGAGNDYHS